MCLPTKIAKHFFYFDRIKGKASRLLQTPGCALDPCSRISEITSVQ